MVINMSSKREIFSKRLKEIRMARGLSHDQVSKKCGVARSTFAGYEINNSFPPVDTLALIAQVLQTSTDYLIGLTDDPEPKDPTHNIVDYLANTSKLNWNGVPVSDDDLKPLKELFEIIVRDRMPKIIESQKIDDAK